MNLSTNRQACSRDIGKLYAKHQILKFVINGGGWGDNHKYSKMLNHLMTLALPQ